MDGWESSWDGWDWDIGGMSTITIHPRGGRALPRACLLLVGLSRTLPRGRALGVGRIPPSHSAANGDCIRGRRRSLQLHTAAFGAFRGGRVRRRTPSPLGRCAATQSVEGPAASQWEFAASTGGSGDADGDDSIRNVLVCGDGDLSYSAGIAPELDRRGIDLFATVLEDEETHNRVYRYSRANTDIIASAGRRPMFGVDATDLSAHFGDANDGDGESPTSFDRIQFNFPHWRGKANHRYNRQLLSDFLGSAAAVLSPRGEIHVALCDGQGGCSATTLQEWRSSWTASLYAAENGLLLARTFPFEARYQLSAHRGVDRPFKLGNDPRMHVFAKPDGAARAPREVQLCCRHELHVVVPDDGVGTSAVCSLDQILGGDAVQSIIQGSCVPDGIRVEVPARKILDIHETHWPSRIAVFLVVYCGERHPVTRDAADRWRENAEREVSKYIPLRENRKGRTVSRPFPYPALHPEIKYHTSGER